MTTGLPPDATDPTSRAAAELGVAADADPARVRTALLRRLEEADFVPPEQWLRACATLGGPRLPGSEARWDEDAFAAEERLREEVEDFAGRFFRLPLPQRRRQWRGLVERCAHLPPLAARLRELTAGLDVDPATFDRLTPVECLLAQRLCELLPLRPPARAARRREVLAGVRGDPQHRITAWEAAARSLEAHHPELAGLDPDLVERLATWTATRKRRQLAKPRPIAAAGPAPAASSGKWPVWILVFIGVAVVRLVGSFSTPTHSTPTPAPFQLPRQDVVPPIDWKQFQQDQERVLKEWEKRPNPRPGDVPPGEALRRLLGEDAPRKFPREGLDGPGRKTPQAADPTVVPLLPDRPGGKEPGRAPGAGGRAKATPP